MQEFFGSVWWLIVSLGVLVTFHEFGHYWVGRRFGIRVLRFSVGFGYPLWKRVGRDGTEWVVAAIPLGGYVKFLDEREDDVPAAQRAEAFNTKPAWQRFLVALAGPAFNLILCVVLLWAMFLVGKTDYAPVVGQTSGIAAASGLQPDDELASVDGRPTPTWTHAISELMIAAIDRRAVAVNVQREGQAEQLILDLARLPADFDQAKPFQAMGLEPRHWTPYAIIGKVSPNDPAGLAGLQRGDRVVAVGDVPVTYWEDLTREIKAQARKDEALRLRVERDGKALGFAIVPRWEASEGEPRWILGVSGYAKPALLRYGPIDAVGAALAETGDLAGKTVGLLRRILSGQASLKNISGPLTIAQAANLYAEQGVDWFLAFLAMLSISLCIMNLLPIPILDGGHLVYCLVEMVKGSPVSERAMAAGQYVGLALLVGLMGLAFYNDILRLVSS